MHVRTFVPFIVLAGCFAESPNVEPQPSDESSSSSSSSSSSLSSSSSSETSSSTGGEEVNAALACRQIFDVAGAAGCCEGECACGIECFEPVDHCSMPESLAHPESLPDGCADSCYGDALFSVACDAITDGVETFSRELVDECIAELVDPAGGCRIFNTVCAPAQGEGQPMCSPACNEIEFFARCAVVDDCWMPLCGL